MSRHMMHAVRNRKGPGAPMAVVLVHSSDIHVDDDIDGRRYTGLIGLRAVLDKAAAMAADVVLLAGDTFDNHRVSAPVLLRAAELIARAGRPVVLLPGNHDPALSDCLFRRAGLVGLADVHILGVTHTDAILFDEHALEIVGRAHRSFGDMPPLPAARPRAARWQVVMAHGHYVPPCEWHAQSHRAWRISDADLTATGADYIALGHWDRPTPVGDDNVRAFYSGSPDLAGTVNVVRLDAARGVDVSREALDLELQSHGRFAPADVPQQNATPQGNPRR
jgi:DNA repair exonuclease SbcCD nuclease subunit